MERDNPWDSVVFNQERVIEHMREIQGERWLEQRVGIIHELVRFRYLQEGAACQVLSGPTPFDRGTVNIEFSLMTLALTAPGIGWGRVCLSRVCVPRVLMTLALTAPGALLLKHWVSFS